MTAWWGLSTRAYGLIEAVAQKSYYHVQVVQLTQCQARILKDVAELHHVTDGSSRGLIPLHFTAAIDLCKKSEQLMDDELELVDLPGTASRVDRGRFVRAA